MLGNLLAELSRLSRESFGALQESLWLAKGILALREFLLQTQEGTGIFEEPAATLLPRLAPAGVQSLDLGTGELLPHDLLGQPLAGFAVVSGQRNQSFHRRLGGDPTAADRLLDRERKLVHQAQPPRHPAVTSEEPPRQLILAPAETAPQLGEQPPLLERRRARPMGHLPCQHQRFGRLHLPHQSLHRVVVTQLAESLDALVTVDDHIAPRHLAVGDHHDRLLLAVLFHGQPQTTTLLATVSAQRGVRHLQLVPLQLHDRLLRHTSPFWGKAPA